VNHELVDLPFIEKRRNDAGATHHPDVFSLFFRRRRPNALIGSFTKSTPSGTAEGSGPRVKT
jgi:hypothetical protein